MSHCQLRAFLACLMALTGCGDRPQAVIAPPVASEEADDNDTPAFAADAAPSFARAVAPLLARFCLDCHSAAKARGDVRLEGLREDVTAKDLPIWQAAARAVRSGAMPPPGKPRPAAAELDAFNAWLDAAVFGAGCSKPSDPGRVTLRRLNKAEYNNTIRDLTRLDVKPADEFPADDVGHGFDNIGDVLSVPPLLAEKYLAAALRIVREMFQSPEARERLLNPPAEDVVPFGARGQPPARDEPRKGLHRVRTDMVDPTRRELDRAELVLRVFADRAYRRPVTYAELNRLLRFVEESQKAGEGTEPGLRLALQAVLISPHFLFKVEDRAGAEPRPLNDFELATRLSYFLWSSMPDEELFRVAAAGRLRQRGTLQGQVRRMLGDAKSAALVENFAGQWLQTRALAEFTPDPARFPDFDEPLRRAMLRETEFFCRRILCEDRSVLEFLDADYTFVNTRLARHYGLPDVHGDAFREVCLTGTPRGGVVTQAAILAVTSNPTRTSPVKRGRWILENLLGVSIPKPPPGADAFKSGPLVGTLRQRMESHRTNPACAGCHGRLDPPGLGLENFDAVGRWRTEEEGGQVDASGTLPDGRSFRGPAELRAYLRSQSDVFCRCLAEKLFTYALGRGLGPADQCAVETAARRLARNGYRFSSLLIAVATCEPFQKRGAVQGEP
jgi:hypothetical protein